MNSLVPAGMKPTGPVVIDRERIDQKVPFINSYMPLVGGDGRDLINGSLPELNTGSFNEGNYSAGVGEALRTPIEPLTGYPVTLACKFLYTGNGDDIMAMVNVSSSATGVNRLSCWYDDSFKRFRMAMGDSTLNYASVTLTKGKWYTVYYIFRSETEWYITYWDNSNDLGYAGYSGDIRTGGGLPFVGTDPDLLTLNGQYYNGNFSTYDGGVYEWAAVFNAWVGTSGPGDWIDSDGTAFRRGVRAGEFRNDPYQFLQPAGTAARLVIGTPATPNDTTLVPDPKWEEPAMLVPTRKPTGPVVIDKDNPLAENLIFASHITVDGAVDLVSGDVGECEDYVTRPSSGGNIVMYSSVVGNKIHFPNAAKLPSRDTAPFSIAIRFKKDNAIANRHLASIAQSGEDRPFSISGQDGGSYKDVNFSSDTGGYNRRFDVSQIVGIWYTLVYTVSPVFNANFYGNGSYVASLEGAALGNTTNQTTIGGISSSSNLPDAEIEFLYYWDRRLSRAEAVAFTKNPYQFLIPA